MRLPKTRLAIFLSHTSELGKYPEDLSYVAKAKQAIESAGHMVVDMATFRAQPIPAEDYDTKRVKECDIYIGIYGNKYGSLTSKKISFTESEYDAAVEAGLKRYIFLLDEDSAETDLPNHCLKPDKYTGKRRAFLKKASNSGIYKLFGNRDHLYSHISDALHDLAVTSLGDELSHHELIDPLLLPFNFNAYRKQRSKSFIGREWLFMQVRSWLQERRDQQGLLITAGFGVGKTAFMAQLVENNNTGLPLAAQHFCQGGQNSTLSPGRFVTSIAAQLVESLPAYRRRLQAPDAIVLLDLLKNASHQPEDAWNQAVVSVLDEIEEPGIDHLLVVDALELTLHYRPSAGEADGMGIANLLAADPHLPRWMRILATSRNDDEVVTTLTASNYAHEPITADHADNLRDLHAYTEVRCETAALNRMLSAAQLSSQQVADKLCEPRLSGGKLLYIQSVLDGIESGRFSLANISDLDRLPQGMSEFYRETFRRAYPHPKITDHYKLMHAILGLLCEQREPLSLSELSEILRLPKRQIRHELETLGALISKAREVPHRSSDLLSEVYYSFDHSSLRLWLTNEAEANPYDVDRDDAQDLIRSWAVDEIKLQRTHLWPYLVRHLRSYIKAEEWQHYRRGLLGNIHWLQARLDHTGINALMQDTNGESIDALESPSRTLKHVLGQAEQTLAVYPQQLASQILARLDRTNMTREIASLCEAAESVCEENQQAIPIRASLNNKQLLRKIYIGGEVQCLYYCEEQEVVLFGCRDGRVGVWGLESGGVSYCRPDDGHTTVVAAIAPVSNGRFASASWDGKVILWSLEGLRKECTLQVHDEGINALVCYRFDRKDWLVTASDDQSIKIWQVAGPARQGLSLRSRPYHVIQSAHADWVTHLLHLGSNEIASGGKDGSIRIWNIRDGSCRLSFQLEGEVISLSAKKSPQSLYAITDPGEGLANQGYRLDLQNGMSGMLTSIPEDVHSLLCLEKTDNLFFLSESQASMIFCHTCNENGLEQRRLCGHNASVKCLSRSSGKQQLLISASIELDRKEQFISTISIWHSTEQASDNGAALLQAHHGRILQIQTNSAGQIYSLAADGSGSLWGHDGLPQAKWRFHDEKGKEVIASPQAFTLNDQQLAIRLGNQLLIYTTPVDESVEAKFIAEISPLSETARTLELSPSSAAWSDVHGLIFGCEDGSILYSAFHSTESRVIQAAIGRIEHMKMLDQFRLFCWSRSSAEDGSFWICELDKKKSKRYPIKDQESSAIVSRTYRVNDDDTHADAQHMMLSERMELLHACNQYLALSHADASLSIWEWIDENQNPILKHRLHGHSSSAIAFLILDDGSYITASTDRTIRRWKEQDGKMIDNIIFVSDYRPTSLYFAEQDLEQSDLITLVIVGDEMGLLHWLKLR